MGRKFSIIKEVNIDKLSDEIDRYIAITNEYNPYIFMNIDTLEAVGNESVPMSYVRKYDKADRYAEGEFNGCKVFIHNDLKFGEIEIR